MIPNDFDTAFARVIELVNDFNKDLANCTILIATGGAKRNL